MLCVNFRFVITGPCTCVLLVVHVESHTFLVSRADWCFWRVFLIVWQTHWSQIRLAIFFNFNTLRSQIFYAEQHDWSEILRHVFTDWFPSVVLMQSRNTYARKFYWRGLSKFNVINRRWIGKETASDKCTMLFSVYKRNTPNVKWTSDPQRALACLK